MTAINSKEFSDKLLEYANDLNKNPENYRGWRTGFPKLDILIGGILRRKFYVVGGKQKSGKSAFSATLAVNLNKQGVNVLYISLEMDNLEMAMRVFSNMAAIDMTKFRDVDISIGDLFALENASKLVELWPGFWDYGSTKIKDVEKVINETQCNVVILDYFQLMEGIATEKRREGLEGLSRRLKGLTNRKDKKQVTVIVPSQVNRASIRSGNMDANAFLDTGALERDCDVALMIMDVLDEDGEEISNKRKIKVVASRVSGVGEIEVYFNGARSLMADMIPEQPEVKVAWYAE